MWEGREKRRALALFDTQMFFHGHLSIITIFWIPVLQPLDSCDGSTYSEQIWIYSYSVI